jgi:hypothetical protein
MSSQNNSVVELSDNDCGIVSNVFEMISSHLDKNELWTVDEINSAVSRYRLVLPKLEDFPGRIDIHYVKSIGEYQNGIDVRFNASSRGNRQYTHEYLGLIGLDLLRQPVVDIKNPRITLVRALAMAMCVLPKYGFGPVVEAFRFKVPE